MKFFSILALVFLIFPNNAKSEFENQASRTAIESLQLKLKQGARTIDSTLYPYATLTLIGIAFRALDIKLRNAIMHRNDPFLAEDFASHLFCKTSPFLFFSLWVFLCVKYKDYIER